MREVRSGQYEAGYTIRQRDRFPPGISVSGAVTANGRYVRTPLTQSLTADAKSPVMAQTAPVITSFSVVQIVRIESGAELKFTLSGTSGAAASFTIDGVVKDVPMREVRSGQYEGGYTIRRQDRFPPGVSVSGAVTANGRYVRTPLTQPLIGP